MITVPVIEMETKFRMYLETCQTNPVMVINNEKPVAILIPPDNLERLLLVYSTERQFVLNESQTVFHDQFWQELSFYLHPEISLADALKIRHRQKILELEKKQAEGYARYPVRPGEFDGWENEQVWGDEWHETW